MKKLVSLLLCAALCLSASGCVSTYLLAKLGIDAGESYNDVTQYSTSIPQPASDQAQMADPSDGFSSAVAGTITPHEDVLFADMVYTRPDTEQLEQDLNALVADVASGKYDPDTLLARYDTVKAAYDAANSQMSLAYLLYAFDVTVDDYKDEYDFLANKLTDLDLLMTDVSIALLEDDATKDATEQAWSQDYIDTVYAGEALNSEEIQDLVAEELQLTFDYDELLASFVYKENGKTYTVEDIVAASDWEMYDRYTAKLNEEAGALYLKLLKNRNAQSQKLGFGSYAAYMYEAYGRDYSVTDAKALHQAVKKYLAPLYYDQLLAHYYDILGLDDDTYDFDAYLPKLQAAMQAFSPYTQESLDYLLRNDLYDFTVNQNKMEGSFTTYLGDFRAPFIFSQWDGSSSNVSTVIHEFGHFTNYYHNAASGWSSGDSLDLAEVDSQGLELLMMNNYESFYGDNADAARANMLLNGLYAVLSGCMEDEFQQIVYENPDMTLTQMNETYLQLSKDYVIGDLYGYTGMEWVMIPHTFQSPMYYISYAVSMLAALEVWQLSETDYDAGRTAYLTILMREEYAPMRETVQNAGCSDPISADTVKALANVLKSALS